MSNRTGRALLPVVALTACLALAAFAVYVFRPPKGTRTPVLDWPNPAGMTCSAVKPCFARWTRDGAGMVGTDSSVVTAADSVVSLSKGRLPLFSSESVTVVTILTRDCPGCSTSLSRLAELKPWASLQGLAMHVVTLTPEDAAALAKSSADSALVGVANRDLATRLGLTEFPATAFIDARGVVRLRVQGKLPVQEDILSSANENTGWAGFGAWRGLD